MQTSDERKIATREGWVPGQDVIVPPPRSAEAMAKRPSKGYDTKVWYYSTMAL